MSELAVKRPRPPRKSKNAARLHAVVQDIAEMAPKLSELVADLHDEDDRETPPSVYDPLHEEFKFTLDVAASHHNHKCRRYFAPDGMWEYGTGFDGLSRTGIGRWPLREDGLTGSWKGERVWCNPPFSGLRLWVEKTWDELHELAVMLLPNNRCEQPFWQDMIEPYRDRAGSIVTTRNLRRRRPFVHRVDGAPVVGKSPPFGLVVVIWDRRRPKVER